MAIACLDQLPPRDLPEQLQHRADRTTGATTTLIGQALGRARVPNARGAA
jgi:hypothetical protein